MKLSNIFGLIFTANISLFAFTIAAPYNALAQAQKPLDINDNIVYWYRNYDSKSTFQLLSLALKKTEDLYGATFIQKGKGLSQGRAILEIAKEVPRKINLINVVPDSAREKNLLPIYIASDGGLIGLRVCIINRKDIALFENIRSYSDLEKKGITFGQGQHWPDTKILQQNGMKVVTSALYESLYPMLRANRFNCFLRGVGEASSEIQQYGKDDLTIEKTLLFSYPSTSLFFVNKKNKHLAARIELGLRRAILDGSFKEYFDSTYKTDLQQLKLNERRIIRLNNPLLTDKMMLQLSKPPAFYDAKLQVH